jgi:alpha-L-rhamnosidase
MACSVYGAQYLLEALYQQADPDAALALLTSTTDRSFMNMINVGSTITLEAWDVKYKPNLDWNHAWGAAPANILPRYILGVRPLTPGFAQAVIAPQPGSLAHVEGTVATLRGPVRVVVDTQPLTLTLTIPANMTANVAVPPSAAACTPLLDGQSAQATLTNGVTWLDGVSSGQHVIRCQ